MWDASLTFKNLPLKGKTPYLSLPTTSIPARAKLLAESPSVNIIVHYDEFLPPASLASSSFGIPNSFDFFFPGPKALAIFASSLALSWDKIISTIFESRTDLMNLSVRTTVLPKSWTLVFRVSLV